MPTKLFKQGEVNNPNGRPKGSFSPQHQFVVDLFKEFKRRGGQKMLAKLSDDQLVSYCQKCLPKEISLNAMITHEPLTLVLTTPEQVKQLEAQRQNIIDVVPESIEQLNFCPKKVNDQVPSDPMVDGQKSDQLNNFALKENNEAISLKVNNSSTEGTTFHNNASQGILDVTIGIVDVIEDDE